MQAETAYNVFRSLPKSEQERFLAMVQPSESTYKNNRKEDPIITLEEATEWLLANHFRKNTQ